MWTLAFISAVGVLYFLDPNAYAYGFKEYPSLAASTMYNGFHRIAWTFSLGWVIFACFHGYGGQVIRAVFCMLNNNWKDLNLGWVNTFLSWKAFQPLSKLSFGMYLLHYNIEPLLWGLNTFRFNVTHFYCVSILMTSLGFLLLLCH